MKNVELLLTENVENLGIVGDVVKVKPGYARNYLLPYGKATVPSDEKIAELAERRKEVEAQLKAESEARQAMMEKLVDYELTMKRAANDQGVLFGGVSQHDIAEALREEGFAVEDRYIRIGSKINHLDTYEVPIVINKDLKTEIKLWVVSDRPVEELEAEAAEGEGEQAKAEKDEPRFFVPVEADI